jgi:antitoxin (DNA-binding transcriptional repressor) of toxin-antitoxin stability system
MTQYNVGEAKAKFSELLNKALAGEEVIIARDNRPLVRIEAIGARGGKRTPGSAKGRVVVAPDFDETPPDFMDYVE